MALRQRPGARMLRFDTELAPKTLSTEQFAALPLETREELKRVVRAVLASRARAF